MGKVRDDSKSPSKRKKRFSEISDDVRIFKEKLLLEREKLQNPGSEQWDARLSDKDLENFKRSQVEKDLEVLRARSIDVDERKAIGIQKKKRTKVPDTVLSRFLNFNLILFIIFLAVFGFIMLIFGMITFKSIVIAFEDNSSARTKNTIFHVITGLVYMVYAALILESLLRYRFYNLKFGSFFFVVLIIINSYSIYKTSYLFYNNSMIVKRYLWSGIEFKEDLQIITNIQEKLQCCGVFNWTDWYSNIDLNEKTKNIKDTIMHKTCCHGEVSKIAPCASWSSYYKQPCSQMVIDYMKKLYLFMVIFYIFVQFSHFLAFVVTYSLASQYIKIGKRLNMSV